MSKVSSLFIVFMVLLIIGSSMIGCSRSKNPAAKVVLNILDVGNDDSGNEVSELYLDEINNVEIISQDLKKLGSGMHEFREILNEIIKLSAKAHDKFDAEKAGDKG